MHEKQILLLQSKKIYEGVSFLLLQCCFQVRDVKPENSTSNKSQENVQKIKKNTN